MDNLNDYDYELPERLIAQSPLAERDMSSMLVYNRTDDTTKIQKFRDILNQLRKGDVVVINETRVIPARLFGVKESGAKIEILLLEQQAPGQYEVLLRPGKRLKIGDTVNIAGKMTATLLSKNQTDGTAVMSLSNPEMIDEVGVMPLPHYIRGTATKENYNTVYARVGGSSAAPTAGLHWTQDLMAKAQQKGVIFIPITLDVGLGTFRPVKTDDITKHQMHKERYNIPAKSADIINQAIKEKRRIIATGTTSLRTLEGCFSKYGQIKAVSDSTDIYIYPPYEFKVVNALITNFHLPKSTLLMLVSAFIGREKTLQLYEHAKANGFRFYSFGDCMLLT